MKITQKVAVKLFKALGFKTAGTWSISQLNRKIKNLTEIAADAEIENPKVQKLVKKLLKAEKVLVLANDDLKDVTPSKTAKKKTKKKKAKASSKKSEKKETKKTKKKKARKSKSQDVAVDKFGSKLDSNYAKLNAALGKKPRTMSELLERAGLQYPLYDHINSLVEAKMVQKTDKGYALVK